jgi:uncharacterized protein (TIGR02391 family)
LEPLKAMERLTTHLHPEIERRVRSQFLLGEYELAAFTAMKFIEIRVRELSGRLQSDIGVRLMRDPSAVGDLDIAELLEVMDRG